MTTRYLKPSAGVAEGSVDEGGVGVEPGGSSANAAALAISSGSASSAGSTGHCSRCALAVIRPRAESLRRVGGSEVVGQRQRVARRPRDADGGAFEPDALGSLDRRLIQRGRKIPIDQLESRVAPQSIRRAGIPLVGE